MSTPACSRNARGDSELRRITEPHEGAQLVPGPLHPTQPLRIIWIVDGPYIATEPQPSTCCVIDDRGRVEHVDSCMTSRATRRATPNEVMEWRVRE
jgi:hypothetical protein